MNTIKLFPHFKTIRAKMVGGFGLMVLLIIVSGGFSYFFFNTFTKINKLVKASNKLQINILGVKDASSLFLLYEKTNTIFMATDSSFYVEQHLMLYNEFKVTSEMLRYYYEDIGIEKYDIIDELDHKMDFYALVFLLLVEKVKERGFGKYGLAGKFENSMNKLEQYNFGEKQVALSKIRFYEKEYFLSGDNRAVTNLQQEIFSFYLIVNEYIPSGDVDEVMKLLENYELGFNKLVIIDDSIGRNHQEGLQGKLNVTVGEIISLLDKVNVEVNQIAINAKRKGLIIFLSFISGIVIIGVFISYLLPNQITRPISKLRDIILLLSKGILPEISGKKTDDEIGEMTEAINQLIETNKNTAIFAEKIGKGSFSTEYKKLSDQDVLSEALINMRENFKKVSLFAEKIGKGDFKAEYKKLSDDDVLGTALINMRNSLKVNSDIEEKRNWTITGFAKFGEILQRSDTLKKFGYEIISNLVDFVNANQAVIYAINDVNAEDKKLEMIACYAYGGKIIVSKKENLIFRFGEGLIGEVARSQTTIQLKEIPNDYLTLSSGLVNAKPQNVLIVPLIMNNITYGVIELASLNSFSSNHVNFVENLGEKLAITINNIQANITTHKLLKESQKKSEELQVREEELKQQNEELKIIQEKLQKVNLEVTKANTRIKESIDYAQTIQESILPTTENIRQIFPQSFIYYKPKDVVSGDFPWFYKKGDTIYIATVDCTGHGVPGALLSFIGYFLLNEIVSHTSSDPRPSVVLDLLQIALKRILKQRNSISAQVNDGMDIALSRINFQKSEVQYAGAYRPLYHICDGKLTEYKGDRHPIGGIYKNNSNFTNHSFRFKKGDSIFFFTDGLPDQFGGANPEIDQYSTKRIQKIILNNQNLTMHKLAKKFEDDYQQWKSNTFQYDDVLLIGIRF